MPNTLFTTPFFSFLFIFFFFILFVEKQTQETSEWHKRNHKVSIYNPLNTNQQHNTQAN